MKNRKNIWLVFLIIPIAGIIIFTNPNYFTFYPSITSIKVDPYTGDLWIRSGESGEISYNDLDSREWYTLDVSVVGNMFDGKPYFCPAFRTVWLAKNDTIVGIDVDSNEIRELQVADKIHLGEFIYCWNYDEFMLIMGSKGALIAKESGWFRVNFPEEQTNFFFLYQRNRGFWATDGEGLYFLENIENSTWNKVGTLPEEIILKLPEFFIVSSDDYLWVSLHEGIYRLAIYNDFKPEKIYPEVNFTAEIPKPPIHGTFTTLNINEDNSGRVWISIQGEGVWLFDGNKIDRKSLSPMDDAVFNIKNGCLYTYNILGLYCYKN